MTVHIVELNDAGVRVARGVDELVCSPGYATLVDGRVVVGEAAQAHAWMSPRHAYNRYWHALDTVRLTQFGRHVRHAGDLAYLHLQHVLERSGRPGAAIVAVPGSYQRTQLSLLLGIAQAAGLTVSALVDSAVAAGATLAPGRYIHVQALLHQCVLTELEVDGALVVRGRVDVIAGAGMVDFERRLVGAIVAAFLARCRFDPLHQAATEQVLHSRLAEWLTALASRPEIPIAVEYRGTRHETRIEREALGAAIAPLIEPIRRRLGHVPGLLDYRLAAIPGFGERLDHAHLLPADAVFKGCVASPELETSDGGVMLRTTLAVSAPEARQSIAQAARTVTRAAPAASHLLIQQVAFPLGLAPLYLAARGAVGRQPTPDAAFSLVKDEHGVRLDVVNGAAVMLNGSAISGSVRVAPGDHITMPDAALLFLPISVQADDAI